jgi:hypothetical protein
MFIVKAGTYHFVFDKDGGKFLGMRKRNGTYIEEFLPLGKLHSLKDTPAKIDFEKQVMQWYSEGKLHRISGPAEITFDNSGKIIDRKFYKSGKLLTGNKIPKNFDDGIQLVDLHKWEKCVKSESTKTKSDEKYFAQLVLDDIRRID